MLFCEFVVRIIYLIFGESSLQLIEVLQLQYALVFQLTSLILDPRRFLIKWVWFQQKWVWSNKRVVLLPKLFSPPPEKKISCMKPCVVLHIYQFHHGIEFLYLSSLASN